jgi:UDP-sulfoquinovose synthase
MRVLILGGDGYLGWPTAMAFADKGYDVTVVDNYLRRDMARETNSEALLDNPDLPTRADLYRSLTGKQIRFEIGDCNDWDTISRIFQETEPETVVHYAEQPSAPYSMKGRKEASRTFQNNLGTTFNLVWAAIEHAPDCHIIKLGTMGEYGTPNINIEEGWLDIDHKGRRDRFLFPRAAGSLYHTTKILDTDLLWFYVRLYGLRVTDLMQGPVYGISTLQADLDHRLMPNFHYDDIFGTVVNRFLVQAVAGVPLTVYGKGGQTRGYLNILDTLQCVELAMRSPVDRGELRILNQVTETFSVNQLADRVIAAARTIGIKVTVNHIENPRKEMEEHYYNPAYTGLLELGLEPHLMSEDVLCGMLNVIQHHRDRIDDRKIQPRVRWS